MRLTRLLLVTLILCCQTPSANAVDGGVTSMGGVTPGGGVKTEAGPAPKPSYTCDVTDWSKPLMSLTPPGIRTRTPPAESMWTCSLPRKSGGYGKADLGAPCTCDAYGARWAGKIGN